MGINYYWYYHSSRNRQYQMIEKKLGLNTAMVMCYLHCQLCRPGNPSLHK